MRRPLRYEKQQVCPSRERTPRSVEAEVHADVACGPCPYAAAAFSTIASVAFFPSAQEPRIEDEAA